MSLQTSQMRKKNGNQTSTQNEVTTEPKRASVARSTTSSQARQEQSVEDKRRKQAEATSKTKQTKEGARSYGKNALRGLKARFTGKK